MIPETFGTPVTEDSDGNLIRTFLTVRQGHSVLCLLFHLHTVTDVGQVLVEKETRSEKVEKEKGRL